MKETTQKFIQGFGSVLDLSPSIPIRDFSAPKRTVEGQIEKAWKRVGNAFKKAVTDFDSEICMEEKYQK